MEHINQTKVFPSQRTDLNLYKIIFEHYSPKDSKKGVATYVIASNGREVVDFLREDNKLEGERWIFAQWEWYEEDGYYTSEEDFIKAIIDAGGEPDPNYDDLYYGKTHYYWEFVETLEFDADAYLLEQLKVAVWLNKEKTEDE